MLLHFGADFPDNVLSEEVVGDAGGAYHGKHKVVLAIALVDAAAAHQREVIEVVNVSLGSGRSGCSYQSGAVFFAARQALFGDLVGHQVEFVVRPLIQRATPRDYPISYTTIFVSSRGVQMTVQFANTPSI